MKTQFTFELETSCSPHQLNRVTLPFARRRISLSSISGQEAHGGQRMQVRIEASMTNSQAEQVFHFLDKQIEIYQCTYYRRVGREAMRVLTDVLPLQSA